MSACLYCACVKNTTRLCKRAEGKEKIIIIRGRVGCPPPYRSQQLNAGNDGSADRAMALNSGHAIAVVASALTLAGIEKFIPSDAPTPTATETLNRGTKPAICIDDPQSSPRWPCKSIKTLHPVSPSHKQSAGDAAQPAVPTALKR